MGTTDTKTRILDAAQCLIQSRGINGMSYQDLSESVGIRKASIHHHFPSKLDMLNALLQRYQHEFADTVDAIVQSKITGKSKLKRYCALFQGTLATGEDGKTCLCGMMIAEIASLDDSGVQKIRQFVRTNTQQIVAMIESGMADGSLATQKSPKAVAELVLATLEGGLMVARSSGGPQQFDSIVNQLISLLTR